MAKKPWFAEGQIVVSDMSGERFRVPRCPDLVRESDVVGQVVLCIVAVGVIQLPFTAAYFLLSLFFGIGDPSVFVHYFVSISLWILIGLVWLCRRQRKTAPSDRRAAKGH